jgi:predicted TIM-barrel fold metal-dependent hydrolase
MRSWRDHFAATRSSWRLTAPQRRAILYDNAARFLRLDAQTIARHHGR